MTTYKTSDVVLVKFPFTDLVEQKKRPALVLNTVKEKGFILYTICMIASKVNLPLFEGDNKLKDWKDAGLLHPSIARLSKLVTIEGSLIEKKLGSIRKEDKQGIKESFKDLYSSWL